MQKDSFLNRVYSETDETNVAGFYDAWAGSYDTELAENTYRTPERIAHALVETGTPCDVRILDYGCGTGLSGVAFVREGYTLIDGTDLSPGMLAEAESKQIYGRLWIADADTPRAIALGSYDVIAGVGVISPGAAPASLLGDVAALLDAGGRLAFSLNDHALQDPSYLEALRELPERGMALRYEQYGEHLPGIGLKSTVYVFECE